ncbi:uncharacterized protein LOC131842893 [Achroia grisella]|uniref:uncharacterized protein LOC131842893 n=1 Tax=Achroia grisella TaxID=688607 RepID=UPI0027D23890|nr:uncharacterized protein LOC131842893 [Achroia grisella]
MELSLSFLVLVITASTVNSQVEWDRVTTLVGADIYFKNIVQETMQEVERRGWWNLKFNEDITQTFGEVLYDWHANGTVTYTNGFLVSIQQLEAIFTRGTLFKSTMPDNSTAMIANVMGELIMRDAKIGFDAIVEFIHENTPQRYTGIFNHNGIVFEVSIQKNLLTNELSTSVSLKSLPAGSGNRMVYMPANNVTEVLSRVYVPSNNWNGVRDWGSYVFGPIIKNVSNNHIDFPQFCLGCLR